MEREQILIDLTKILEDVLETQNINLMETTKAADISGWDSLAHINLIEEIENYYNIKFSLGEIVTIKNVGDLITLIKQKI